MLPSYSRFVLFFVLQGCGFGGFEGGGCTPDPSEWSQMEAMVILPISYLHDIAVKCLVFLSYTPSNSSALCAVSREMILFVTVERMDPYCIFKIGDP